MAALIREAVTAYLSMENEVTASEYANDPIWQLATIGDQFKEGGFEDASENHDKYIYGLDAIDS